MIVKTATPPNTLKRNIDKLLEDFPSKIYFIRKYKNRPNIPNKTIKPKVYNTDIHVVCML